MSDVKDTTPEGRDHNKLIVLKRAYDRLERQLTEACKSAKVFQDVILERDTQLREARAEGERGFKQFHTDLLRVYELLYQQATRQVWPVSDAALFKTALEQHQRLADAEEK